jgi:hypothetical protein
MNNHEIKSCTAFYGTRRIAAGELRTVAEAAKAALDRDQWARILIFDDATSEMVELDLRGSLQDILERINVGAAQESASDANAEQQKDRKGPGRPKLGVVAREVTLFPRHWDWLASQPGGTSVALRKLVEQARRASQDKDRVRRAQESAYRFISVMGGNEPGFEEASRALFAINSERFYEIIALWPSDVKDHAVKLTASVFTKEG